MDLRFEVGTHEKHAVEFYWDQMWGRLRITVDGERVVNRISLFSARLTQVYRFEVGDHEKHRVRVEKRRKLAFAGFRPQDVTAFVDDEAVASDVSNIRQETSRRSWIILCAILAAIFVAAGIILTLAVAHGANGFIVLAQTFVLWAIFVVIAVAVLRRTNSPKRSKYK